MYTLSAEQLIKVRSLINNTDCLEDDVRALLTMEDEEEFQDTVFSLQNSLATALQLVRELGR